MSEYIGNDKFFHQPEVNQYGSHMVMTNVMLPSKGKYLNMDTRHGKQVGKGANYNMVMPDRVDRVKSMKLTSAEIPITYYNISSALNNNVFGIVIKENNSMCMVKIPDNNYTIAGLIDVINSTTQSVLTNNPDARSALVDGNAVRLSYDATSRKVTFSNSDLSDDLKIVFNVTQDCVLDTKDIKFKLGYLLGFRESSYDLPKNNGTFTSEAFCNVSTPRYLYLVIDEFSNGNPSSFVTMLQDSQVSKSQILAKITIDQESYDTNVNKFGSIYFADEGKIISDTRVYTGPINLQRMNVQLVNEQGLIMDLNNMDFSFCLELTHE